MTAAWQQGALEYLQHGQTPFFRLRPAVPAPGAQQAPSYEDVAAVLLGVCWDGGTTYQPGARLAPFHVRRTSALLQSWHPHHGVDVFGTVRAIDGGNVVFPPFDATSMRVRVQAEVQRVLAAGAVPFVVGGDHSVALPALRAAATRHPDLAVVHVDAHADTSDGETWGEPYHHGTPLRHALDEKLVAPDALFQLGLRATARDRDDDSFAKKRGARVITMDEIARRGVAGVMAEVTERIGARPTYVTFDVDAIDPAHAPGTGTPVPGGLTSREAIALLRALAGVRLAGMDLVEVAPPLDHADMTSHLAAHLLFEGLALLAVVAPR